jgi:hypothetical protein
MAWRAVAGGQTTLAAIIAKLKDTPVEVDGQTWTMRAVHGEDAPVFEWLATNLYHNDPAMLSALIEDFGAVIAGFDLNTVLPQIGCPILLLQADPSLGDAMMVDTDVERAMTLLPSRVEGSPATTKADCYCPSARPDNPDARTRQHSVCQYESRRDCTRSSLSPVSIALQAIISY